VELDNHWDWKDQHNKIGKDIWETGPSEMSMYIMAPAISDRIPKLIDWLTLRENCNNVGNQSHDDDCPCCIGEVAESFAGENMEV
jgi:hypothetical protein